MFPNYNGTCHWQQDSHPKTTSQKMAQIRNIGENLMVDGDTGPYYYPVLLLVVFLIIALMCLVIFRDQNEWKRTFKKY